MLTCRGREEGRGGEGRGGEGRGGSLLLLHERHLRNLLEENESEDSKSHGNH